MEFEVTDPATNQTLVLEGESSPTEAELEEIFSTVSRETPSTQAQPETTSTEFAAGVGNEALQGATFGFSDEIQSVIAAAVASPFVSDKTFGELMKDARNSLRDEQGNFREQNPKTSLAANVVGGIATGSSLFKGATTVGQLATAGGTLGTAAGAGFSDSDEFFSLDTALDAAIGGTAGAALGVAAPKAINAVSRGIKRFTSKPNIMVMNDKGQITQEAVDQLDEIIKSGRATKDQIDDVIREELRKEGVLTPEQANRFNLFAKRGITPDTASVTQVGDDFLARQSAAKTSGPVAKVIAQQDDELVGAVTRQIDDIKPTTANIAEANSTVFSAIDDLVTKLDDEVGKAYKTAAGKAGDEPVVSATKLIESLQANRGENQISKGLVTSVRTQLKDRGLIGSGFKGTDKKISVKEAEEIRQFINTKFDSTSGQGRTVIRQLKAALDDEVASAVGDDVFADARAAKINMQRIIERASRNKRDISRGSFLEDVIDNKIPDEKIIQRLIASGTRKADLIKTKAFLTEEAGEQGIQAWKNIKASVINDALEKATAFGKGEGGAPIFNANKFRDAFKSIRASDKFNTLFDDAEREFIDDIIEIGRLRLPKSNVALGGGPSEVGALKAAANKEIISLIPGAGKVQKLVDLLTSASEQKRLIDPLGNTARKLAE